MKIERKLTDKPSNFSYPTLQTRRPPVASRHFIPFSRPWFDQTEIDAVTEVLTSKWIGTGPKTAEFERRFAEYVGAKHALAVSSCTAALHLALAVAGIREGDEVITTPYTFTATAEAIRYTGARPVLVDIDPVTLNIDVNEIEKSITSRTKAVVPVHIGGLPCDMNALLDVCQRYHLFLVDDAAHAISAEYGGRRIGSIADFSAFSFYANKNLSTGEGGMITTNSDQFAEALRPMRLHGLSGDAWSRQAQRNIWQYDIMSEGYKYNMTDIQAALGLCQLAKLEKQGDIRRRYVQIYESRLGELSEVRTPRESVNNRHAWHLYIIQLRTELLKMSRDELVQSMRQANIECNVHYIPLHLFTYYQKRYGYRKGDFPKAELAFSRVLSLPMHPGLTEEDIHTVVDTMEEILRR